MYLLGGVYSDFYCTLPIALHGVSLHTEYSKCSPTHGFPDRPSGLGLLHSLCLLRKPTPHDFEH